jgi:hypothetical protein
MSVEQEERIRHADTQAAGIMAFVATAVGVIAGGTLKLAHWVEVWAILALWISLLFAIAARLADVVRKPKDDDSPPARRDVAWDKGKWIACSLVCIALAVVIVGADVLV